MKRLGEQRVPLPQEKGYSAGQDIDAEKFKVLIYILFLSLVTLCALTSPLLSGPTRRSCGAIVYDIVSAPGIATLKEWDEQKKCRPNVAFTASYKHV